MAFEHGMDAECSIHLPKLALSEDENVIFTHQSKLFFTFLIIELLNKMPASGKIKNQFKLKKVKIFKN